MGCEGGARSCRGVMERSLEDGLGRVRVRARNPLSTEAGWCNGDRLAAAVVARGSGGRLVLLVLVLVLVLLLAAAWLGVRGTSGDDMLGEEQAEKGCSPRATCCC